MDLEQLQAIVQSVEARVWQLETRNAELHDLIWNHPKFVEHEERMTQFFNAELARYAEDICIGLNKAFKEHFENDEYEISEEEFNKIICDAQRLAF